MSKLPSDAIWIKGCSIQWTRIKSMIHQLGRPKDYLAREGPKQRETKYKVIKLKDKVDNNKVIYVRGKNENGRLNSQTPKRNDNVSISSLKLGGTDQYANKTRRMIKRFEN